MSNLEQTRKTKKTSEGPLPAKSILAGVAVLLLISLAAGTANAQIFVNVPTTTTLWAGTADFNADGLASLTNPGSGLILTGTAISTITGKPVRHLWYGDTSNGLCRLDPEVEAVIPPVGGIGGHFNVIQTCVGAIHAAAFTPGQLSFDGSTNTIYAPDTGRTTAGIIRLHYDPAGDAGRGTIDPIHVESLIGTQTNRNAAGGCPQLKDPKTGSPVPIVPGATAESVLREELQRTLIAAEAGYPQRALGGVTFLAPSEDLKAFAQEVANGLNAPASFLTDGAVPSIGLSLCMQCATGEGATLNLLPDEWRSRRRTAAFRQRLIRGAIAVGVVYALALAVFLTLFAVKKTHLLRVESEIKSRQAKFLEAKDLQGQLIAMTKQLDTQSSALEVLREVASRLPENVKLTYFQYKKDQTVTIKAQAPSASAALDFQTQLEKCELFSKIAPGTSRTEPGSGLTKFDLTCTLKTAAGVGTTPKP